MSRKRVYLTHRRQRSVLTDMLPFEAPPTFSNRGFYRFLRDHEIDIENGHLRWVRDDAALDPLVGLLFGIKDLTQVTVKHVVEWGRLRQRRSVPIAQCRMATIPFNFRVAHKLDGRVLSVVHPRNQVAVASFYAKHSALIIYYASLSPFSIRKPVSVSRYAYFKDKLHEQQLEVIHSGVEEDQREYEQLGSYFVYKEYRNIHKFFESYKYHRYERKYDAMVQIDLSKCFDSIYTHSLPWAVLGKQQTKFNTDKSVKTFAGRFDALMQTLNQQETNGIVIGPEFSRIFAEIILQSVDLDLLERLENSAGLKHKVDFQICRYVDDYFVFYNADSTQLQIMETLQSCLKEMKLSINTAKLKYYKKPIITEITVAKERVSSLLNDEVQSLVDEIPDADAAVAPRLRLSCHVNANRLIVRYKTAIWESKVEYGDLLNYTFAILENKIDKMLKHYDVSDRIDQDRRKLVDSLIAIMEFAFFSYSASPKVNHTIRVCRMISTCVSFLNDNAFRYELKHQLYKFIHDNIIEQLTKNTMNVHREVESLYLLISLSQIGREYWLPESSLARHFLIEEDDAGNYVRTGGMNHFSITVLLSYVRNKKRYDKLRSFLEKHIIDKLSFVKAHCPKDAEAMMLLLDVIVCPYVHQATKYAVGDVFGISNASLDLMISQNDRWFTVWGDKFDITKELDAKRSREVY